MLVQAPRTLLGLHALPPAALTLELPLAGLPSPSPHTGRHLQHPTTTSTAQHHQHTSISPPARPRHTQAAIFTAEELQMAASVRRAAEEQVGPGRMGLGVPFVCSAPTRSSSGFATSVCPFAPRVAFLHPVLPMFRTRCLGCGCACYVYAPCFPPAQ